MLSLATGRTSGSWRRGARPRAALRLREWETPVDDHDGDPFRPRLPALLGVHGVPSVPSRSATPPSRHRPPAAHASLTSFASPIRRCWQPRHPRAPQRRLAGELPHCGCPAAAASRAKTSARTSVRPRPSASRGHQRSPRPGGCRRPAAPAHQRRLRRPRAARSGCSAVVDTVWSVQELFWGRYASHQTAWLGWGVPYFCRRSCSSTAASCITAAVSSGRSANGDEGRAYTVQGL